MQSEEVVMEGEYRADTQAGFGVGEKAWILRSQWGGRGRHEV